MDGSLRFMVGVSACVGVKGEEEKWVVSVMCMQSIHQYIHVVSLATWVWTSMLVHMSCSYVDAYKLLGVNT